MKSAADDPGLRLYSDDTCIFFSNKSVHCVEKHLKAELTVVVSSFYKQWTIGTFGKRWNSMDFIQKGKQIVSHLKTIPL